jgi:hypothetical protein
VNVSVSVALCPLAKEPVDQFVAEKSVGSLRETGCKMTVRLPVFVTVRVAFAEAPTLTWPKVTLVGDTETRAPAIAQEVATKTTIILAKGLTIPSVCRYIYVGVRP